MNNFTTGKPLHRGSQVLKLLLSKSEVSANFMNNAVNNKTTYCKLAQYWVKFNLIDCFFIA